MGEVVEQALLVEVMQMEITLQKEMVVLAENEYITLRHYFLIHF